jgi:sarcosine oxidase, subunit delta
MLRIQCPHCGERDEPEFVFGGPAHMTRPPLEADDSTWTTYLFTRDNPAGMSYERWLHAYGCGKWFNMARNTLTHTIVAVYTMAEPRPEIKTP